jgi:hypothetical protein
MNIITYLAEKLDKKKRSMLCIMTERSFRLRVSEKRVQRFRVDVFKRLTAGTFQPLNLEPPDPETKNQRNKIEITG